jgi:hypothetical protein
VERVGAGLTDDGRAATGAADDGGEPVSRSGGACTGIDQDTGASACGALTDARSSLAEIHIGAGVSSSQRCSISGGSRTGRAAAGGGAGGAGGGRDLVPAAGTSRTPEAGAGTGERRGAGTGVATFGSSTLGTVSSSRSIGNGGAEGGALGGALEVEERFGSCSARMRLTSARVRLPRGGVRSDSVMAERSARGRGPRRSSSQSGMQYGALAAPRVRTPAHGHIQRYMTASAVAMCPHFEPFERA